MGAVSTSKKSSAGKNVLVFFIVFIILEMLIIFGIGKVFKNKDVTPNVMGYSLFMTKEDLVQNGPDGTVVAVPKNVLVIASNGLPDPTNKIGCAILCENIDGVGTGVYWLADMTENKDKTGVDYTVTNGTQSYVIKSTNIVGVCASYFVTAGKVIGFVTQKFGMICCAVVPLFLLVLIELIIAIATHSSDDDEDEDEDDEEEEKTVELDDFLFGGQSEGEQIAKRRRKAKAAMEESEETEEPEHSDKKPEAEEKSDEPEKSDNEEFDIDMKQPSVKEREAAAKAAEEEAPAAAAEETPALAAEEVKEESSENAPEQPAAEAAAAAVEEAPEAAPEKRPAKRQGTRPSARRRRAAGSSVTSDASLEDLMKLMEEEQNKLRNKLN